MGGKKNASFWFRFAHISVGTIANNVENAKTAAESKPFFAFKCVSADFNIFTILCKRTLANLLPQCV
jgi:hypothetical protein